MHRRKRIAIWTRSVLLLVAVADIAPIVAIATVVPMGDQFRLEPSRQGYSSNPRAVALAPGGFAAVWLAGPAANEILGRCLSVSGGSEPTVLTIATVDFYEILSRPRLAPLSDGGFVVIWRDKGYLGKVHRGVMAQRFSSRCLASGDSFRVDDQEAASVGQPDVANLGTDGFVVVWLEQDAAQTFIRARAFDNAGTPAGDTMVVEAFANVHASSLSPPVVTATDRGQFVVVWADYYGAADERGIHGRRVSFQAGLGPRLRIDSGSSEDRPTHAPRLVDVAEGGPGGFVVAWQESWRDGSLGGSVSTHNVLARAFDGTAALPELPVTSDAPLSGVWNTSASVAGEDGTFVVAWDRSTYYVTGDVIHNDEPNVIRAGIFERDGSVRDLFEVPSYATAVHWQPDVAKLPDGTFLVVWIGGSQTGEFLTTGRLFCDDSGRGLGCGTTRCLPLARDRRANTTPTVTDALRVLRSAVAHGWCPLCVCDVDGTGGVSAGDALLFLQRAVGLGPPLVCSRC